MKASSESTLAASTPLETLLQKRDAVYAAGKMQGERGRWIDAFPTGITKARGEMLRDLVRAEGAQRTVETGFALGLSSSFILEATLGAGSEAFHTAIDPYQSTAWDNAGVRFFSEAGLSSHFSLVEQDSSLALPAMVARGEVIDVGFVDGSHTFDGAFTDLFYMRRLVRPGGLIILDDVWMPAVMCALRFFETNLGMEMRLHKDSGEKPRLATLRVTKEPKRTWDHFVPFA